MINQWTQFVRTAIQNYELETGIYIEGGVPAIDIVKEMTGILYEQKKAKEYIINYAKKYSPVSKEDRKKFLKSEKHKQHIKHIYKNTDLI